VGNVTKQTGEDPDLLIIDDWRLAFFESDLLSFQMPTRRQLSTLSKTLQHRLRMLKESRPVPNRGAFGDAELAVCSWFSRHVVEDVATGTEYLSARIRSRRSTRPLEVIQQSFSLSMTSSGHTPDRDEQGFDRHSERSSEAGCRRRVFAGSACLPGGTRRDAEHDYVGRNIANDNGVC
jgi:hypothetical protein